MGAVLIPLLVQLLSVLLGEAGKLISKVIADLSEKKDVEKLVELAKIHVENFGKANVDNEEKRRLTVQALKEDFAAQGKVIQDSLINLAIELVIRAQKGAVEALVAHATK